MITLLNKLKEKKNIYIILSYIRYHIEILIIKKYIYIYNYLKKTFFLTYIT